MKALKISLIALFCVVTVLFASTTVYQRFIHPDDPPTITCADDVLEIRVKDGESALLTGVTATDPQDGDLTDRVRVAGVSKLISRDTAKVTYLVFDSDNNMGSYTRQVRYTDYERPHFEVNEPLLFSAEQDITPSALIRAVDVLDGDISGSLRISTLNLSNTTGIYTIMVQVTNSLGDTARQELPVIVTGDLNARASVRLSTYLVYLEQGSDFDAASYLRTVTAPDGKAAALSEVQIAGEVDTATAGTYNVTYTYGSGDTAGTAILTVVIQ